MILAITGHKLLKKGCIEYWCYAMEVKDEEVKIENIHTACKFLDVFYEDLQGFPLNGKLTLRSS